MEITDYADKVTLSQMKAQPALYALTVSEYLLFMRAEKAIDSTTRKYKIVTEQGTAIYISDEAITDIRAAVEREGISVEQITQLAEDIITRRQWYTLLMELDANGQAAGTVLKASNDNSIRVQDTDFPALIPDSPAFSELGVMTNARFAGESDIELLSRFAYSRGIAEEYRFIPAMDLAAIRQVRYLFSGQQGGFTLSEFKTIRQGAATNTLTKTYTARRKIPVDMMGTATITKGDLIVNIANYSKQPIKLKASTYRLLDAITAKFTETGGKRATVEMPLSEYMELCGLSDVKEARQQVKEDLDALYRLSLSFQGKGKHSLNFIDMRLCAAKGIVNGVIQFSYSEPFYQILLQYPIMALPTGYFRINAKRNPNSPALLRKITEHKNMNVAKSNADTISVRTLLECADSLPRYEDIRDIGGINQRIIDPFERDLDALAEVLTWEYCHTNGEPLTDVELAAMNYHTFEGFLIRVHWKEYPARPKELAIERQRKAAEAQPVKRKRGRPPKNKQ